MRVALQPADTKLQAGFAISMVVILFLRGLSLRVQIYVMTFWRTNAGINKAVDAGAAHGQIRSTDALRRVLPTRLTSHL